jgi:hypothetical protein
VIEPQKLNTERTEFTENHGEFAEPADALPLRLRTFHRNLKWRTADERNFGYSAAHEVVPVPLLPSGPGGVRGTSSHRARSSTHRQSRQDAATANEV